MPNIFTKSSMLIGAVLMAGCASQPRVVTASVPLVYLSQEKPNKQEIPTQYWSVLSDPLQTSLKHDKYHIQLAPTYTSALGVSCRELTLSDQANNIEKRIACEIPFVNENNKQDKAWFVEKLIIESSSYVEL